MTSKIKVDNINKVSDDSNIINKCGTTITLGASGDSINLAAGASQSGFGRTGTVDWVTTPKVTGDSPVTAATGSGYFLNTTGGAITINLPAGSAGSIVSMADYAATWQTYNVTVAANGSEKIGGDTNDAILNTEGQSVTFVYVDGVQGWVNTMDSTSNVRGQVPFIVATGGNAEVTCGDYKTHIFTAPGTFCVSNLAPTAPLNVVDYFVVAGGAAGGSGRGGGGGAGGFRMFASSPGCHSPLNAPAGITVTASPYPIIVGGGGPGQASFPPVQTGGDGTLSTFDSITSAGGGGGGTGPGTGTGGWGQVGGSGGGQAFNNPGGGGGNEPPVSPPQGNPGGSSNGAPSPCAARGGGGGGGAGGAGGNTPPSGPRGIGGTGSYLGNPFIGPTAPSYGTPGPVGSTRYFAGGGGAGGQCGTGGSAPLGGGGTAGQVNAAGGCHATVNTGGGSGGAGEGTYCGPSSSPTQLIGNGGSGIVMIRYKFQ